VFEYYAGLELVFTGNKKRGRIQENCS